MRFVHFLLFTFSMLAWAQAEAQVPGQALPKVRAREIVYTIQEKDTLGGIISKHYPRAKGCHIFGGHGLLKKITKLNGLEGQGHRLEPGSILRLPTVSRDLKILVREGELVSERRVCRPSYVLGPLKEKKEQAVGPVGLLALSRERARVGAGSDAGSDARAGAISGATRANATPAVYTPMEYSSKPLWHWLRVGAGSGYSSYTHREIGSGSNSLVLSQLIYKFYLAHSLNYDNRIYSDFKFKFTQESYNDRQQGFQVHYDDETRVEFDYRVGRRFWDSFVLGLGLSYGDVTYMRFHDVSDLYFTKVKRWAYSAYFFKEFFRSKHFSLGLDFTYSYLKAFQSSLFAIDAGRAFSLGLPIRFYPDPPDSHNSWDLSFSYTNDTQATSLFKREYEEMEVSLGYSFGF